MPGSWSPRRNANLVSRDRKKHFALESAECDFSSLSNRFPSERIDFVDAADQRSPAFSELFALGRVGLGGNRGVGGDRGTRAATPGASFTRIVSLGINSGRCHGRLGLGRCPPSFGSHVRGTVTARLRVCHPRLSRRPGIADAPVPGRWPYHRLAMKSHRCFLLALVVAAAVPGHGASFDCSKAHTTVETRICASPRLSGLDEELASVYDAARGVTVEPKELAAAQREWLRSTRAECGDDADCLEHAMLLRMAELRWSPDTGVKLFASERPPESIFGRYSETEPVCVYAASGDEIECSGEAESYVDLRRGDGNRVRVRSELTFFNGHLCDFDGEGEWAGDELRVPSELEDLGCVLILRFRDGKLVTDDPGGRCKGYCGARGGFQGIELPKLSPAEADARRKTAAANEP